MAKPVFTWHPDEGASETITPSVNVTKFGDGYEQRVQNGINPEAITWSMTFTGNSERVMPIRSFLRKMGAMNSFIWTNPLGERGVFVCRAFPLKKISSSIIQMSVTFEKVYEPEH